MTPPRPAVRVLGTLSPAVQHLLGGEADLPANAADAQAVLIDGSVHAADGRGLAEALASSEPVIIVQPSAGQLAAIARLTGVGMDAGVAAVAVSRSGSGEYRTAVSCGASGVPVGDDGSPTVPAAASPVAAAGAGDGAGALRIAELLDRVDPPHGLRAGPDNLFPPEGAQFGSTQLSFTAWAVQPQIVPPAVRTHAGKMQYNGVSALFDVFVYWVDGERPPYYRVIIRQQLTFTPGRVIVNGDSAKGFLQCLGRSSTQSIAATSNGRTLPLRLEARSPVSGDAGSQIAGQMMLIAEAGGGPGPVPFNYNASGPVGNGTGEANSKWAVVGGLAPGLPDWVFHSTEPWNPQANPDMRDWNIFYQSPDTKPWSEMLKPWPAFSWSDFPATTFSVWRIDGPRTPVVLTFLFEYFHRLIFLVTPPGSTASYQIWRPASMFFSPRFSLDLAQVAPITR